MFKLATVLLSLTISTAVAADVISDRARDVLTNLALDCFQGSKERPALDRRVCEDAIERWRLLSAMDRMAEADQLVEDLAVARREFYEVTDAMLAAAMAHTGRRPLPDPDPAQIRKADSAQQHWKDDIAAIRELLRR